MGVRRSVRWTVAVDAAAVIVLGVAWLSTDVTARDLAVLAVATPLLGYFMARRVKLPMPNPPEREGGSELATVFVEQLAVPLAIALPVVPVATVVGLCAFAAWTLLAPGKRSFVANLYAGAYWALATLVAGGVGHAVVDAVGGRLGLGLAVAIGVPILLTVTAVATFVLVRIDGDRTPMPRAELAFGYLIGLVVLVPFGIGALLAHEADELFAAALIALLPLVLVELLAQSYRANVELRRRDAERAEFLRLLIESGDQQRRLLAGDLHDGPLQGVLASRFELEDVDHSERVRSVLGDVAAELREIMRGLMPQPLEELGLRVALERDRELFASLFPAGVDLDYRVEHAPEPAAELALYRIVHEGMINAHRHGAASHVDVVVEERGRELHVRVTDDGRGFRADDADAALQDGHLGVATMRERAAMLGGRLSLTPGERGGTVLDLTVPLPGPAGEISWPPVPRRRRTAAPETAAATAE